MQQSPLSFQWHRYSCGYSVVEGLATADSTTGARVQAGQLAVSVLSELRGLPFDAVLKYTPSADAQGQVRVELLNTAGELVSLPVQGADVNAFADQAEIHVHAACKDKRGHIVEVQSVGFTRK